MWLHLRIRLLHWRRVRDERDTARRRWAACGGGDGAPVTGTASAYSDLLLRGVRTACLPRRARRRVEGRAEHGVGDDGRRVIREYGEIAARHQPGPLSERVRSVALVVGGRVVVSKYSKVSSPFVAKKQFSLVTRRTPAWQAVSSP